MIYITDYVDDSDIELNISGEIPVYTYRDSVVPFDEITVLLVWHEHINKSFLARFPNVKFIQRYGVGYDEIDLEYLRIKNIKFSNNPDYGVEEVALTAMSMILDLTRNTSEYNSIARKLIETNSKTWQENTLPSTQRLSEQSLGIVGFGRIGQKLAILAKNIFKNIYVYDPFLRSGVEKVFNVTKVASLDFIAQKCHVVSFNCPVNDGSRGMINKEFINKLDNCVIVNTARGELIHSLSDIADGLHHGKIKSIGLDVLPKEPPIKDSLIDQFMGGEYSDRIIINPHTAYYSQSSYLEMRTKAAQNCIDFIRGGSVRNLICD
tara:strand:- start:36723 stop:37685 length:963 start_codon:yes stop_codon:yes gene_type:complete